VASWTRHRCPDDSWILTCPKWSSWVPQSHPGWVGTCHDDCTSHTSLLVGICPTTCGLCLWVGAYESPSGEDPPTKHGMEGDPM
jgi:hypothetical protein